MPISKAVTLIKDCYELFIDYGYDGILSDLVDSSLNKAKNKSFFISNLAEIQKWRKGLSKISNTQKLMLDFKKAPNDVQLALLMFIGQILIPQLEQNKQEQIIDFPFELHLVMKEILQPSFNTSF